MNTTTTQNANNRGQQRTFLLLMVILLLIPVTGTQLGAQTHVPTPDVSPVAITNYSVEINQLKFMPDILTVHPGDKIQWKNSDFVPHTVTVEKVFNSGSIAVGGTWILHAPARKGEYIYSCTFHPNMRAKLIVE